MLKTPFLNNTTIVLMPRLTPLCPLKIHLSGGGRRELKEEVKSQTKAPGFMFGPSAHEATDPPAPLHREHGQLCQTMLALLSLLKSTTSTSPPCSEHSKEVSVWRWKNYGLLPFSFWANLCLPGYTKPCWISATNMLYLPMLRAVPQATSYLKTFPKPFFFFAGHFCYTLNMRHILSAVPSVAISCFQRNMRGRKNIKHQLKLWRHSTNPIWIFLLTNWKSLKTRCLLH